MALYLQKLVIFLFYQILTTYFQIQ